MRFLTIRTLRMAAVAFALVACDAGSILAPKVLTPTPSSSADAVLTGPAVVISQVYGGGGNTGATYKNDYIELHNRGTTTVDLTGWSVQYVSSAGPSGTNPWTVTALSGSIQPGGYYLVQEAAGAAGTVSLPTPQATGTLALSATSGKVILASSTATSPLACPASYVDMVTYGSVTGCTGATSAPTLSNTTATLRGNNGCAWTSATSLSTDFSSGPPNPRNAATTPVTCGGVVVPPATVESVTVSPASAAKLIGETQQFTATAYGTDNAPIAGQAITWSSSATTVATVSATGLATGVAEGDATITATASGKSAAATFHVNPIITGPIPDIRLSELHYDNSGNDAGEAIEIEGPVGTSMAGWTLVLYNGNSVAATDTTDAIPAGSVYNTTAVTGTLAQGPNVAACNNRGVVVVNYPFNGIQNGGSASGGASADGIALVDNTGKVVEFLSYEGAFTAADGPAAGLTSTDIRVSESGSDPQGLSLKRTASGASWTAASANNFGYVNACGGPAAPPPPSKAITFSGRDPVTDPALPVGFEAQLFASEITPSGTVATTITWESLTPDIASIDAKGVYHALAAGTATFRATATDGTTATRAMPVITGTHSAIAYAGNTLFGEPKDADASDDYIVRRPEYTTSYNVSRGIPNWVSYRVDADYHPSGIDRCNCFTFDPLLPASFPHYTTGDYTGAGAAAGYGIDRGHLARSFDRTGDALDNAATYYFSNIVPQASDLNQGPWKILEDSLGNLAYNSGKSVYVIAGAFGSKGTVKNEGVITIPTATWKVAVVMGHNQTLADIHSSTDVTVFAVIMPNVAGIKNTPWTTYKTTVADIEAQSGYDVLAELPDSIECRVESRDCAVASTGTNVQAFPTDPTTGTQPATITFGNVTTAGVTTVVSSSTLPAGAPAVTGLFNVGATPLYYDIATQAVFSGQATVCVDFPAAMFADGTTPALLHYDGAAWVDVTSSVNLAAHSVCGTVDHFSPFAVVARDRAPVATASGPAAGTEGSALTFTGSATDADGDALTYAWTFSDGGSASGAQATHTFADNGTYTATLTVTDVHGATATATTSVAVSNVAPTATLRTPAGATEGTPFTLTLADVVDPSTADLAHILYAFDCGTGAGWSTLSSSPTASCTAADNGTLAVRAKVSDGTDETEYTASVVVANAPPSGRLVTSAASVVEGTSFALSLADLVDVPADLTGLTVQYDCGTGTLGASMPATGGITCATTDNEVRTVRALLSDKDGGTATLAGTVTVTNDVPVLGSFAGASILRGEGYTSTGAFTDAGADTWTATVNYGDGSGAQPLALTGKSYSLSHRYTTAGTFTVTVTVRDDDGGEGTQVAAVVVSTPAQAIASLQATVTAMLADGKLTAGELNALEASLSNAIRGTPGAANQVGAFINKVEAMQRSGRLDAATASSLITFAQRIIASMG